MQRILYTPCGSALVVTMLVLVAVTILGIVSINTSVVELNIAHNEQVIRQSFYLAEGASMEGIQRLMGTLDVDLNEHHLPWHHGLKELRAQHVDFRNLSHWDVDLHGQDNAARSLLDDHVFFAAIEKKVATGGSLIQTNSRLYLNTVYGLCTRHKANSLIEVGYYMRY